ncbi:FAD:protein FMN transferase [Novosphingobium olei]|uniref:FAD:protein FMN transferase n=1 Tax=Novosphingobium olei TaxID=2728851 RepID=A0A7Y0BSQ3_9SPHN|nr:FAD:protein FMN transferase [Novosphingobium olei]NML95763.1 FAD:protein FMN transferase [Novosphingobium olei]
MLSRCRPLLGTFVEITVPDGAEIAIAAAFAAVSHVQERMSFHEETSDLAAMRRAPPGDKVAVSAETVAVLSAALAFYRQSDGLFDITIGSDLVRDGFLPRPPGSLPGRCRGTSADIEIVDELHVRCHAPMLIDLGGIAKGYAVDQAVRALQAQGVIAGLVNAGGDMRMFGHEEWPIMLRDGDGRMREHLSLANCAIASSANLRDRRWRLGRWRTPHIGVNRAPVVARGRTTIVAPDCMTADAMTKIAMADRALAYALLASLSGQLFSERQRGAQH